MHSRLTFRCGKVSPHKGLQPIVPVCGGAARAQPLWILMLTGADSHPIQTHQSAGARTHPSRPAPLSQLSARSRPQICLSRCVVMSSTYAAALVATPITTSRTSTSVQLSPPYGTHLVPSPDSSPLGCARHASYQTPQRLMPSIGNDPPCAAPLCRVSSFRESPPVPPTSLVSP